MEGPISEYFPWLDPEKDREVRQQVSVKRTHVGILDNLGSDKFKRFSSWKGLVSALSILRHFVLSYSQKLECKEWHHCSQVRQLLCQQETDSFIFKCVQSEAYRREVESLRDTKRVNRDSSILDLDPFLDEKGLLRVGDRLSRSSLTFDEKHPVILPGGHHVAKLVSSHFHESVQHQGRLFTEGAIRKAGFWITGGKRLISSLIFKCVTCKKLRGKFAGQKMSDLPVDRVEQTASFTYVGVDVFGSWFVVTRRTRGGQASSKRWAVMSTCLSIRAVHLEVIEEMSSSAFVNALHRFVSVRGKVKQFRSDGGSNFVGARDCLQVEAINVEDNVSQKVLTNSKSVWMFNAPHSSHMGGSWERMIRVVRRVLDAVLLNVKTLTQEVLCTLMAEVAAMVHARPIVPVSSDPEEPEILTPATLLTHKVQCDQPVGDMDVKSLLKDYQAYRNGWPMDRITRVFPSKDSRIRKVEVCVVINSKKNFYVRPVVELVVLVRVNSL